MADPIDWLTLDEAKRALSIKLTNATHDDVLALAITGLSERFDELTGPAVVRTITDEAHDGGHAYGWRSQIELNHGPVTSYSSVTEYQDTVAVTLTQQTPGILPSDGFLDNQSRANPGLTEGIIVRTFSGYPGTFFWGVQNIVVTYEAGRFADTGSVSSRFKGAMNVALKNWWRQYELSISAPTAKNAIDEYKVPLQPFPTFAIPNAAKQLLQRHLKPQVGFGA